MKYNSKKTTLKKKLYMFILKPRASPIIPEIIESSFASFIDTIPEGRGLVLLTTLCLSASISVMSLYIYAESEMKNIVPIALNVGIIGGNPLLIIKVAIAANHGQINKANDLDFTKIKDVLKKDKFVLEYSILKPPFYY